MSSYYRSAPPCGNCGGTLQRIDDGPHYMCPRCDKEEDVPKYVSNMGKLYSLVESEYREFLILVADGNDVGVTLDAMAKDMGLVENVTHLTAGEARAILESDGTR